MKKGLIAFLVAIHFFTFSPAQVYHYKTGKVLPYDKPGLVNFKEGVFNSYPAEYSILITHENRFKKDSRIISIPVVRLKSYDPDSSSNPIFLLYGGPGESNLKPELISDELLRYHDYVIIGYRGVDGSVKLACPNVATDLLSDELTIQNSEQYFTKSFQDCLSNLQMQGVDITGYSIDAVIQDIEQVRVEFGYNKISFVAFSFGTIVAQNYALKHNNTIDKMVLIGPRPSNNLVIDGKVLDDQFYLFHKYYKENVLGEPAEEKAVALGDLYHRISRLLPDNSKFNLNRFYIYAFSQLYTLNKIEIFFDATSKTLIGDTVLLAKYYNEFYQDYPKGIVIGDMYLKKQGRINIDSNKSTNNKSIGALFANNINHWYSPSDSIFYDLSSEIKSDTVRQPTLFICGDLDVAAPPALIKEVKPLFINGTYKELIYTGHLDFFFSQKSYVDSLMISFINN